MKLTPQQRAALDLFGFPDYVPAYPNFWYPERATSFNQLVARYKADADKAP